MTEYEVVWKIEVEADSYAEAAHRALGIQRDPASSATHFEVRRHGSALVVEVEANGSTISTKEKAPDSTPGTPSTKALLTQMYKSVTMLVQAHRHAATDYREKVNTGQIEDGEGVFYKGVAEADQAFRDALQAIEEKMEAWEAKIPQIEVTALDDAKPRYVRYVDGEPKSVGIGATTAEIDGEAKTNPRQQLLADALDAVSRTEYGGPEDSFRRIADLWNQWVKARGIGLEPGQWKFTPADVAVMLMQLKMARLMSRIDHRDSIVDIAGYAACLAEIVEEGETP